MAQENTQRQTELLDNSESGLSGITGVRELQMANINALPQGADDSLKQAILKAGTVTAQQSIQEYIEKTKSSRISGDFFKSGGQGKSQALEFFESPDAAKLTTMESYVSRQEARITRWEAIVAKWETVGGKKFTGKSTEEFAEFVGEHYEERIIGQTPPPGKDPTKNFATDGRTHYRWTAKETEKNLQWKRALVENKLNPMAFFDWLDDNMETKEQDRDKEIMDWAEKNVKTAESQPKLFTKKYIEQLKKIAENAKAGKPNNLSIKLFKDFDAIIVSEQKLKRVNLEQDASKEYDAQAKLIGPSRVQRWKTGWLKTASIEELNDWFKLDDKDERKFDTEIESLKAQETRFLEALSKYGAEANKQEYLDWFYSIDGDKREQCFEYLAKQQGKLDETQKKATKILGDRKFISEKEIEALHLPNLSKLSQSEQTKKVDEVKTAIERREGMITRFRTREAVFKNDMKAYEEGSQAKDLKDILHPIIDVHEKLQEENCGACFDTAQKCEEIRAEYEVPESDYVANTGNFTDFFEEDKATETLLHVQIAQKKQEAKQGKISEESKTQVDIQKAASSQNTEKREMYRETLTEFAKEQRRAANDELYIGAGQVAANDPQYDQNAVDAMEQKIALGSPYFQNSIHQNPKFVEKYNEVQQKKEQNILQSNDAISDVVNSTQAKQVSIDVSGTGLETINKMTKTTHDELNEAARAGEITITKAGREETKEEAEKTLFQRIKQGLFFGKDGIFAERQASKFSETSLDRIKKIAALRASSSDTKKTSTEKLAEAMQSELGNMRVKKPKK